MTRPIERCVLRGENALGPYLKCSGIEESVVHLISDIQHYCQVYGLDFSKLLKDGSTRFQANLYYANELDTHSEREKS